MRIQPRRQILDIWRSVVRASFQDGAWVWGGRDESNSISDAEQLLCLLYPATELPNLALDRPDAMAEDVSKALEDLGEVSAIPQKLIEVLADYIDRYTDERGEPIFAAGSYLGTGDNDGSSVTDPQRITDEQRELGVVASYSLSVSLCLAALGFMRVFKPLIVRRVALSQKIERLEQSVSVRLTAAMIGLLRSFAVNTVGTNDPARAVMLAVVNQNGAPDHLVLSNLRTRLARVRTRLLDDVRLGVAAEVGLSEEDRLFECGWGWGIVRNATPVTINVSQAGLTDQPRIGMQVGIADPRPYLYSTVVALDGINDLLSRRTRDMGLLNDEQRGLSEALQLRWDLTQRYWSTIARFGENWPLEDIPWRTSDGEESDYFSLLVSAVLVQDLKAREATDDDLNRAVLIFESLAQRGRITRRVTLDDPAVGMHVPGKQMRLGGTAAIGPQLYWTAADFAPLLFKRTLQSARLSANANARDRLMRLAEMTVDHLSRRRISHDPAAGLWDDPADVLFPHEGRQPQDKPSWYLTERVVEALVEAARAFGEPPLHNPQVTSRALDLLHEADHLLNREILDADTDDTSARRAELTTIEAKLARARRIVVEQPGTANALAMDALSRLDELAVAHLDATRSI
ncbi:MAG: hypothetical protein JO266_00410 [Acidobacteria bacterium]|nr:hypothetical protein [Acidobacteriota bacterium]